MRSFAKNRMLQTLSQFHIKQVNSFLSQFSTFSTQNQSFIKSNKYLTKISFSSLAQSAISTNLTLSDNKVLHDYLLRLSEVDPITIRRFWRINVLKPRDIVEILLGFQFHKLDVKNVESLWGIYKWGNEQSTEFKHNPKSCQIMSKMLVQVGLFRESETILSNLDIKEISLDYNGIYSDLIEGYLRNFRLKRAISNYNRMRFLGLVPSSSCYSALIECLTQMGETQLAYKVYSDIMEMDLIKEGKNVTLHEKIVRLLCKDGKIQEARNLIKKGLSFKIEPSIIILNSIINGYCKKKDYDDILSLFTELKCPLEGILVNKIIHSLCNHFGVEKAEFFMDKLEKLGFIPNEYTFAILISWSIRENKLKKALIYFSEIRKSSKPCVYSYNAIISGLFNNNMWVHVEEILKEMKDEGVLLEFSSYKILLAGYFKVRKFDKVKETVNEMEKNGFIKLLNSEDPFCKGLIILGVNPSFFKVKRDNDKKLCRTEFYDRLGNGLYLDTMDLDKYEETMMKILYYGMVPNFNSFIQENNVENDLIMLDKMSKWGQKLSLSSFSYLINKFSSVKIISCLFDHMFEYTYCLNEATLNKVVRIYSKKGFVFKARVIFEGMLKKKIKIENETYSVLLKGLCKKNDLIGFSNCLNLAYKCNWVPELKDGLVILSCLYKKKWLEMLEIVEEGILVNFSFRDYFREFLEIFCGGEMSYEERKLVEELTLKDEGYNFMVEKYCKGNNTKNALGLLVIMIRKDFDISISSYRNLLRLLCLNGKYKIAQGLKEVTIIGNDGNTLSYLIKCNILIFRLFSTRNGILVKELYEKGVEFDEVGYNCLVQGFAKCKNLDFEYCIKCLNIMTCKNYMVSHRSFNEVIKRLCFAGEIDFAVELSRKMVVRGGLSGGGVFQSVIMNAFFKYGKIKEAMEYFDRTVEIGSIMPNEYLIQRLCKYGMLEKACDLLNVMLKNKKVPDSMTYDYIIQGFLNKNKLEIALDFHSEMLIRKLNPSMDTWTILIRKLGEGEKMLEMMNRIGEKPSKEIYCLLINEYRLKNDLIKESKVVKAMQENGYEVDFETHWNLISNLGDGNSDGNGDKRFLSKFLSRVGFSMKSLK